jgi:8-oxo-dGTP pyrophosphatase MutT (NUDIX family)
LSFITNSFINKGGKKYSMHNDKNPGLSEALHSLKKKLSKSKPGLMAQLGMCPNPRPGHQAYFDVEDTSLKAGVLLLLYPRDNGLHLVLTRRTDRVDFHKGQISLPGGRQEEGEGLEQAALREAQEELEIDPASISILGMLTPLYIPPSNYCIYPVVAYSRNQPDFHPSQIEVAEVLEVPLGHLLGPQNTQRETWTIRDTEVEVPFYAFGKHKIWGATAMVLAEFLEIVKEVNLP